MPTRSPAESIHNSEPFSLIHKATQRALYTEVRQALQGRRDEKRNDVAEIAAAMAVRSTDVVLLPRTSAALRCINHAQAFDSRSGHHLADLVTLAVRRLCDAPADSVALVAGVEVEDSPKWISAINMIGRSRLPLLLLVRTLPGPNRPDLRTLYAEHGVPAITVDANDAIAVFRVTTEAAHNARAGRGTSLIETALFDGPHEPGSPEPLSCLEAYMRRHGAWFHPDERP